MFIDAKRNGGALRQEGHVSRSVKARSGTLIWPLLTEGARVS
jgi:hypothetical protein